MVLHQIIIEGHVVALYLQCPPLHILDKGLLHFLLGYPTNFRYHLLPFPLLTGLNLILINTNTDEV